MAYEAKALPLFDKVWEEGGGLFSTGASDDEEIVGVIDRDVCFDW